MANDTCSIQGCEGAHRARGLCGKHYQRARIAGDLDGYPGVRGQRQDCSVLDCDRQAESRGWCHMHYTRWRSHGDPNLVKKPNRVHAKDGKKRCASCGVDKPLDRFPPSPKALHGRGSHCYDCRSITKRLARYGLTRGEFDALLSGQDGECAVCIRPIEARVLTVDHCHVTGRVRALLCGPCNSGIGMFADDPERMRAAARYVESHKELSDEGQAVRHRREGGRPG